MRRLLLLFSAIWFTGVQALPAQNIGALLSPGPLSDAHAKFEGLKNCEKCHEPGQGVSAKRCLECHKPIADRIAAKKGVHREVTDDCVMCHVEHAGRDGEIRPFDFSDFNHLEETGFALDGHHAGVATQCEKCHKTPSFLTLSPTCQSCHEDSHRGALGLSCLTCHSTSVAFKETAQSFDHQKGAFNLVGAHITVACAKCHRDRQYRGLQFAECVDCHNDPHEGKLGATCVSCHSPDAWRTTKVDHSKTSFALVGAHTTVQCSACHKQSAVKAELPHRLCADCHFDPHQGNFVEDCRACHTETAFKKTQFDHSARTKFALTERHAEIACVACHKQEQETGPRANRIVEFRGKSSDCASCHQDPHLGGLGGACASCHGTRSFKVGNFEHATSPDFFRAKHQTAPCADCHRDAVEPKKTDSMVSSRTYRGLPKDCVTCHRDVHLGQLGADCARCHSVTEPKFKSELFDHSKAEFQLAGKHATIECARCHKQVTGDFPAGPGTATRYDAIEISCVTCHKDPHLGQLSLECATCHGSTSFAVTSHQHQGDQGFFSGRHTTVQCRQCHQKTEALYPAGQGEVTRYTGLDRACATCHEDTHRGELGDDCATCHTVGVPFDDASRAFHKATIFPLEGRHLAVPCVECHQDGRVQATPTTCYDCHWIRRQDDRFRTQLGVECEQCHRPTSWTAVTWDHGAATGYRLSGAHISIDCVSCHVNGGFESDVQADCVSCHLADYQRADEPDHERAGFPTDCLLCHSENDSSWERTSFQHASFKLVGSHTTADCASCHSSGTYQGLPSDCVDCHLEEYQGTDDPNHEASGFPTTCETCHNAADSSWNQGRFAHTLWPLVGSHAAQDCASCHSSGTYQGLPSDCVDCHLEEYQGTDDPAHEASGFPTTCETCHNIADASWDQGEFAHSLWPLVGSHAAQDCASCHSSGTYQGLPSDCVDCHLEEYQGTDDPAHEASGFPTTCETCHNIADASWDQGEFAHSLWPLVGSHAAQDCASCHSSGTYQGLPSDCVDCHLEEYQGTDDPAHEASGFPTTCETCHNIADASWDQGEFAHSLWPLVGSHAAQDCASCHSSGTYQGLPSDCVDCHLEEYQGTDDPAHEASGFPTTCETCHNIADTSWDQGEFAHSLWPLVGSHAAQDCASCHSSGTYQGLPSDCVDCHLEEYQGTDDPAHEASGFPTTCETCHNIADASWDQGEFAHSLWPLVGSHVAQDCASCHSSGTYQGLPSDCVDCHLDEYQQTNDPDHDASGFPTTCDTCHNIADASWDQGEFAHSLWPLVGSHAAQDCASCHSSGTYQGLPSDCVDCHLDEYQQTNDPDHEASGFPTTCDTCHNAADASWDQGEFAHTVWPLVGSHAAQDCASCHSSGTYQGLPSDCVDCHLDEYQQTNDPDHDASGFPTTCDTCHNIADASWDQGEFAHSLWPLVGSHAAQDCASCHSSGTYQGLPSDCVDCHLEEYQGTDDPAHEASGFPPTCETCHNIADASWDQGEFAHSLWPLVGSHAAQDCASCHSSGTYQGLPSDCVDCHLDEYQQTNDPDHIAAGFPMTCETCHNIADSTWDQGEFNHIGFPIDSGAHRGFDCFECHQNSGTFAVFTCTTACHPRSEADDDHSEVAGYIYDSPACLSCHPAGESKFGGMMRSHGRRR